MDKRTRTFVDVVVGSVTTVAMAGVTYFSPDHATVINGIIGAVDTMIVFILNLFTKKQ